MEASDMLIRYNGNDYRLLSGYEYWMLVTCFTTIGWLLGNAFSKVYPLLEAVYYVGWL